MDQCNVMLVVRVIDENVLIGMLKIIGIVAFLWSFTRKIVSLLGYYTSNG